MGLFVRFAAVAALLCVGVAPAAAQGPPFPNEALAIVGEQPVTRTDFDRWFRVAAHTEETGKILKPPRFAACVRAWRRALRPRKLSDRALRRRCWRQYQRVRNAVMAFLIEALWVRQEASARGVSVTPREVRRSFERDKRTAFASEREYRRFLRESGNTEQDLLYREELDLLQERLTQDVFARVRPVTDDEVDRYYASHRRRFRGVPVRAAKRQIRRRLTVDRQQRTLDRYLPVFRARYRAVTTCARGYIVPECSNSPAS